MNNKLNLALLPLLCSFLFVWSLLLTAPWISHLIHPVPIICIHEKTLGWFLSHGASQVTCISGISYEHLMELHSVKLKGCLTWTLQFKFWSCVKSSNINIIFVAWHILTLLWLVFKLKKFLIHFCYTTSTLKQFSRFL